MRFNLPALGQAGHAAQRRRGADRRPRMRRASCRASASTGAMSCGRRPRKRSVAAIPYGFAAFPLMPYSGPIFGDGFRFGGEWYELSRNVPAEPTATHGEGWIRPWRTEALSENSDRAWRSTTSRRQAPFLSRGAASCASRVTERRLTVDLKLTNRDHRPMPAGLGLHPYFPKAPGTTLKFDCTGVWPPDAPEAVGMGSGPARSGARFSRGRGRRPDRFRPLLRGLGRDRDADRSGRLRDADRSRCDLRQAADLRRLGLSLHLHRAGDQRQ